jgi:hypothetical protein
MGSNRMPDGHISKHHNYSIGHTFSVPGMGKFRVTALAYGPYWDYVVRDEDGGKSGVTEEVVQDMSDLDG